MLLNSAFKEFASSLTRELKPEKDVPDRFRELIAKLEANSPPSEDNQRVPPLCVRWPLTDTRLKPRLNE